MRANSSECLQNPLVREARQRTMEREDAETLRWIEAEQRQEDAATAERQARANEREEERNKARQRDARLDVLENREPDRNNPRREAVDAGQLMGPRPSPIIRPQLGRQVIQQEWRHFLDKWTRYKAPTLMLNNFPPQLIAKELFNCCCQELQNDLQNVGLQVESTEQDIITRSRRTQSKPSTN